MIGGVTSTVIMAAALIGYYYGPAGSPSLSSGGDLVNLGAFLGFGVLVNIFTFWRRRVEQELLRTQVELKDAVRFKDDFISIVSHELRNPITTITGYASLLERGSLDEASRREAVSDLARQGRRLHILVENLLAMGRYAPADTMEVEPVSLPRIIQAVVEDAKRRSSHRVEALIPEGLPIVLGQTFALTQVLDNLVSNAQKYSSPTGRIVVVASNSTGHVEVCVEDEGAGIPPGERHLIFEPFYRSGATRSKAGLGIGLVVCARLVEAMGGNLWLDPDFSGGARFCFTLQIAS
jgi:signal transduction histidine kinase